MRINGTSLMGNEPRVQHDTPRTPPGWEAHADTLIRLASADGSALAWFVPQYGANGVAFMVRAEEGWIPVLHNDGPDALAARPSRFGCPILFPFPGHMMAFQYQWGGETFAIPRRGSTAPSFTHGFAHTHAWQVTEVAPDRVTATFVTPDDLDPDQRAGYPFAIRLTQTGALVGKSLRISLRATNEGAVPAPVGLGMHPYFAVRAFGGDRTRVRVQLPGRQEHVLAASVPTGEKCPVTNAEVTVSPLGETDIVARTDLAPPSCAILSGGPHGYAVTFAFIEGVRDVVYFTPTDQPSISIEPHTCAPGAASQPEGHPDGLVPLDPGASRVMTVEIALHTTPA